MRFLIFLVAGAGLSACGGGGKLSELDRDYASSDSNSWQSLAQYSGGTSVLAFKGIILSDATINEPSYIFTITDNAEILTATLSGAMKLELVESSDLGDTNQYEYLVSGTNFEGEFVEIESAGYFLDGSALDQIGVSYSLIDYSGGISGSIMSTGTFVQGLPSGSHSYSNGYAMIIYNQSGVEEKYNDLVITID